MVDRDIETARIDRALVGSELDLPEYPDLTSAPNRAGLTVHVTGDGADAAGAYTYAGGAWSGPHGGPSNLPDTTLEGGSVANTAIYSYGDYLTGSVDPNNAKHVVADIDRAATDERYLRRVEDSFDAHSPTSPSADPPTTPEPWTFVAGGGSADVSGGYFYADTPPSTESARSFGADFTTTTAPDGSTISSGTWAIENEYGVGTGGQTLRISGWAQPQASYSSYDDGATHSDSETFYGADDVSVHVIAGDSSLQEIFLPTTGTHSRTASHQAFAGGRTTDLPGDEWVPFSHEAALPAEAAYVRVRLQTADRGNSWEIRGNPGSGNAAILLDDMQIDYPSGIRPSGVMGHGHPQLHDRYTDDEARTAVTEGTLSGGVDLNDHPLENAEGVNFASDNVQNLDYYSAGGSFELRDRSNDFETVMAVDTGAVEFGRDIAAPALNTGNSSVSGARIALRQDGNSAQGVTIDTTSVTDNNYATIRPYASGSPVAGRDIQYATNRDEWNIEGTPRADGSPIVTDADGPSFLGWTALDSYSTTDDAAAFETTLDTGGTTYDQLLIVGNFGSGGSTPALKFNQATETGGYDQTIREQATLTRQTGQDRWTLIPSRNGGWQHSFQVLIHASDLNVGSRAPTATATVAGEDGLVAGTYTTNTLPVQSLYFYAPAGVGELQLYGADIS